MTNPTPAPQGLQPAPAVPRLAADKAEVAALLGVCTKTVDRLVMTGKMPAPVLLGGSSRSKRWPIDGPSGLRRWIALGCPDRKKFEALTEEEAKSWIP